MNAMKTSELEHQLKAEYPLLKCGNRTEFKQRLQWLSEGMLRNHVEHITNYQIDQQEIEAYLRFKALKEN